MYGLPIERVSTIYLPDRKRPMLPTILSDTLCSLKENDVKFAFTLDLYINKETYTLDNYTFKNTIINIRKNYVYDTDIQEKDKLYLKMKDVLISLNNKKSINILIPYKRVHLIAYLMIWMNYTSAKELVKNKCGLYRSSKMNEYFNHLVI